MRALKIAGIAVGSLVILSILLLTAAALLINPNAYKSRIERAVQKSTGRSLVLNGNLHLSVFPSIALRLGPASLGNPPGFPATPFVTLKQASLRVALLPLLRGQLRIGRVEIDGLDAHLLRNAQGRGNWQGVGGSSGARPSAAAAGSAGPIHLPQLAGLTLREARVSYSNLVLDRIDLTIGRAAEGVVVPVSVRLRLRRPAPAPPLSVDGRLQVTYRPSALDVKVLDLQLDQSRVRGALSLSGQSNPSVKFDLNIDRLDLDRYGSAEPKVTARRAEPAARRRAAPNSVQLPASTLRTLQMDGALTVGTLKLHGMTFSQVQLRVLARDGVTRLAPISARLYGGVYRGGLTLDARGAVPVMTTDQTVQNVDVARLLQDFARTQRLTGRGNLTARLTGHGADTDALLHSLDGKIVLDLAHGAIQGIDLPLAVERATALLQRRALPAGHGSGRTSFETFHASADLHDGVATTRDLNVATRLARVRGQGTLNLASEAVNYRLQVVLLKPASGGPRAGASLARIPLDVTGTLVNPQVRPDLQRLATTQIQRQLEQHRSQLNRKVEGVLKRLFGGGGPNR